MESRNETEAETTEMTQSSEANMKDLDYSCFYSTLRAIYGIPSFANFLKVHNSSCEQKACIRCSMADLLHQIGAISNEKSTKSSIWEHICREHSKHSNDPYAFLTGLLLSMEKSSKKSSNVSECFEESAPSVEEMLYGSVRSTFKCSTCQHINITDKVLELSLHESCTINDCLIHHFAPERIDQKCRSCNKIMQVKRKLLATQLPVLCIRGTANGDVNIPRQFSREVDLSKFCIDDFTDIALQYRLVSMVIQSALGQYTAVLYSKDGTYLKCTEFNDQPITLNCMLDVSTFVAFYELKNNSSMVPSTSSFIDPHSTILSTENSFWLNAAFVNYEMNETTDDAMNEIIDATINETTDDEMNDISGNAMNETTDETNTGTNKSFNNTVANAFIETRSSGNNSDNKTNETTARSTMVLLVNESEKNVNIDDSTRQSTTVPPTIEANSNTSIIVLLDDSLNDSSPVLKTIKSELNFMNDIGEADTSTATNPQTTAKKGYKKLRETDCTALNLNNEPKRSRYQHFGSNHAELDGSEVIELDSTTEENEDAEEQITVNEGSDYKTFQIDSKLEAAAITDKLQEFGRGLKELTIYPFSSHDHATKVINLVVKFCGKTLKSLNLREEKNRADGKIGLIFDETFYNLENLENFECDYVKLVGLGFRGFFMRHTNLKKIVMKNAEDFIPLLSAITTYCEQLEELEIKISGCFKTTGLYAEENTSERLQSLKKLRKLTFYCPKKDMTKFTEQLRSLKSLEFLHLYNVYGSLEFVLSLSKLTSLHVLRLTDCYNLKNLNPLANLHQLTDLIIEGSDDSAELDIVNVVNSLGNLKWLDLNKSLDEQAIIKLRKCIRNLPATRIRPKIFIFKSD